MVSSIKVLLDTFNNGICLLSKNKFDQRASSDSIYINFDDTVLKKNRFSIPSMPGSLGLAHMSKNMSAPRNKLMRMKMVNKIIIL